jgi:integrase/recombinase XerD
VIDDFLRAAARRGLRPTYLRDVEETLRRYEREVGLLEHATGDDIERWLDVRSERCGNGSLAVQVSHLSSFYRWAERHDRLAGSNPMALIDRPRVPVGYPRPISEADLAAALEGADRRTATMIRLAAYAGLRACEIARMSAADIIDGQIHVREGKGGKSRVVPCHPSIQIDLAAGYPRRGWLFPHPTQDGEPITANHVSQAVSRVMKKLDIPATLHMCRHRFATELLRVNSGDLVMLQRLLGHASIDQSLRYAAWTGQRAAVDSVALIA